MSEKEFKAPKKTKPPKTVKETKPAKSPKPPQKHRLSRTPSRASLPSILPPYWSSLRRKIQDEIWKSATHGGLQSILHASATNETHVLKDRLPQAFGVYRYSLFDVDLYIALGKYKRPIFSISLVKGDALEYPIQSICLYRARNRTLTTGPVAAVTFPMSAMLTRTSAKFDICVLDPDRSNPQPLIKERMVGSRLSKIASASIFFDFQPQGSDEKEVFEWRPSRGPEVQQLNGRGSGLELVRVMTRELLAVWARPRTWIGTAKKGKMRFLGDRSLGSEFEFLALMSLIAHDERARWNDAKS